MHINANSVGHILGVLKGDKSKQVKPKNPRNQEDCKAAKIENAEVKKLKLSRSDAQLINKRWSSMNCTTRVHSRIRVPFPDVERTRHDADGNVGAKARKMIDALLFAAWAPYLFRGIIIKNARTTRLIVKFFRCVYTLAEEVSYAGSALEIPAVMTEFERLMPASLRQSVFHMCNHLATSATYHGSLRSVWAFFAEAAYGRLARLAKNRAHIAMNIAASHCQRITTTTLLSMKSVQDTLKASVLSEAKGDNLKQLLRLGSNLSREITRRGGDFCGKSTFLNSDEVREVADRFKANANVSRGYILAAVESFTSAKTSNGRTIRKKGAQDRSSSVVMYTPKGQNNCVVHKTGDSICCSIGRISAFYKLSFVKTIQNQKLLKKVSVVAMDVYNATKVLAWEPFKVDTSSYVERFVDISTIFVQPSFATVLRSSRSRAVDTYVYGIH
jgi:hypothetical protein